MKTPRGHLEDTWKTPGRHLEDIRTTAGRHVFGYLRPSMESTSSMKTTAGAVLLARLNTARMYFSPSPNHLLATLDMDTLIKFAPASVATAFASMVLPVPGGPGDIKEGSIWGPWGA